MYNETNNNRNYEQRKEERAEQKPLRLRVDEHAQFPATLGTAVITSMRLTKEINNLFRSVGIKDFYGSTLKINEYNGQLELALFFKPQSDKSNGGVYFVEPAGSSQRQSSSTAFSRVSSLNSRNAGRVLQLTKEGKEVFEELIKGRNPRNNKIDWNRYTVEVTETNDCNNYSNLYLKVYDIDLRTILKKLWGDRNENGDILDYNVSVVRYVSDTPNMILSIQQLNERVLNKLAEEIGIATGTGSLGIVR